MAGKPLARTRQDLINSGEAFQMGRQPARGAHLEAGARFRMDADDELAGRPPDLEARRSGKEWAESVRNKSLMRNLNHAHESEPTTKAGAREFRLGECCYSGSNLILIVASIVGLVVLSAFIQDDLLYEYGEHLLSLAFYRQLIFILAALVLVLLIPIGNALQAFLWNGADLELAARARQRHQPKRANSFLGLLLRLRILYQLFMFLLVLAALVFVAPYIRASSVTSQIDLELKKHMYLRYEKSLSYELLESIQEEYQCCDQLWYRANLGDWLPTSCFLPGSNQSVAYTETCAWVLAQTLSYRCSLLCGALLFVLLALVLLLALDLQALLRRSRRGQRVYRMEPPLGGGTLSDKGDEDEDGDGDNRDAGEDCEDDRDEGHDEHHDDKHSQRPKQPWRQASDHDDHDDDCGSAQLDEARPLSGGQQARAPRLGATSAELEADEPLLAAAYSEAPVFLARANYHKLPTSRSQSPLFRQIGPPAQEGASSAARPIKSALKKSSSSASLDSAGSKARERSNKQDEDGEFDDEHHLDYDTEATRARSETGGTDADSLDEYAAKLRQSSQSDGQTRSFERERPTRRSLLSVRFAE